MNTRRLYPVRVTVSATFLALLFCAPAAARDVPFVDGHGSAAKIERNLRSADFEQPVCRYRRPLIVCTYYTPMRRDPDTYVRASMTIHKTGPRIGYAVECFPLLGVCNREPMRFSV